VQTPKPTRRQKPRHWITSYPRERVKVAQQDKECSLADLTLDPKNARKHNPRNIGMIVKSVGEVGVGRSIVIDEDGIVLAGNGIVEALGECGIEKVRVVQANGNELIAVQRTGLSDDQKKKLALYDNRTAELADWDIDVLKDIDIELPAMLENIFQPQELDELLDLSDIGLLEDEDESPEAPEKAVTRPGQIYQLGPHRLMCGDSTDKSQVEKLMNGEQADMVLTDPPYGINLIDKHRTKGGGKKHPATKFKPVIGDDKEFNPAFILDLGVSKVFLWGGNYFAHLLPRGGRWFVWDKHMGQGMRLSHCELAWSNIEGVRVHKFDCVWMGFAKEGEAGKRVHPNQKPIKLQEDVLTETSQEGESILDLFGGSGSTLIACEKLNRKCHMMEIDPSYCDVIVERYKSLFPEKEVRTLNS